MRWKRVFPGRFDQVGAARHFATTLFDGTGCVEEVGIVVGELASNAVRHTYSGAGETGGKPGWFGLEVVRANPARVAVTDMGSGEALWRVPTVRRQLLPGERDDADSGRGLMLVSRTALTLGVYGSPLVGHTVWADLELGSDIDAWPPPGHLRAV
ncbi:ATP-binding protein [Actinomadura sp. PM05-2]|uniref:ATP-binding protein n=2 Tax=Actinomadura parmotrematis TaxID=2864039 RepID=A0ABS7G3K2_9ACTN|nr:ATP-binding protein [Actinomadura parmotrematis]